MEHDIGTDVIACIAAKDVCMNVQRGALDHSSGPRETAFIISSWNTKSNQSNIHTCTEGCRGLLERIQAVVGKRQDDDKLLVHRSSVRFVYRSFKSQVFVCLFTQYHKCAGKAGQQSWPEY